MTVVARHFALMTEAGFENMTPSCITSFGIYTEILHTWETHPEWEEKTREFLWKATKREFQKPKNLAHTSDVIYKFRNEIAAQKKYSLVDIHTGRPLQVVDHIGCHYAKMFPSKGIGGAIPCCIVGNGLRLGRPTGRLPRKTTLLRIRFPELPGISQPGILCRKFEKEIRIHATL